MGFFCLAALLFLVNTSIYSAPITFNTALPISRGEFIVRQQFIIKKLSQDTNSPSSLDLKLEETKLVSTIVYGVTPDLTLFATLPLVNRELKNTNQGRRETKGIGDSQIVMRYTIFKNDFQGGSFRIAPFIGARLSTGQTAKKDQFGVLPMSVQPGMGTGAEIAGIVATYANYDWELDGQLSYVNNHSSNNVDFGNQVKADVSFQYRLFPIKLSENQDYFINGVIEFNTIDKGRNSIAGLDDAKSGGISYLISPGIQFISERYILEAVIQVPIKQPDRGAFLELDQILRIGFRINF